MTYDRKTFLKQAALGSAALAVSPLARGEENRISLDLPAYDAAREESYWSAVRAKYALAPDLAYFNTGGLGPAPAAVLAQMTELTRRLQAESEHGHERFTAARQTVADFLGADPKEIAFVRNATEGNAIVAAGLRLAPGDEVIFDSHAHPGGSFPWFHQEKLRGVVVKLFEPDPQDLAGNVARIAALITRRTKVVQVSHVTAPTGLLMPAAEISRLCRSHGIWFHVDGAQTAGMIPVAVRALGCDSFATSGHKWVGGPLETGVLFVKAERQDDLPPVLVGAYSGELDFLPGELKLSSTAIRYEYGTRNVAAALGLAEAMRFQEKIGRERIAARGRFLISRVREGLARLPGVEILTPPAVTQSAAMLSFRAAAVPYDRLFERLFKQHRLRCRPVSEQKLNAVRVSTHVFNTSAECDTLVARVAEILRKA